MILKLALRELIANRRFSTAFCFNLGLGLFGFVLLSAFHSSIESSFQSRSRTLLTADLVVSARRSLTESELEAVTKALSASDVGPYERTRVVEMYSMAQIGQSSRLVELAAIERDFPLYGEIRLRDGSVIGSKSRKPILERPGTWVSADLAIQLELKAGHKLKIGETDFEVLQIIDQDASAGWRGFSFAPRIYVGMQGLESTGLLKKGSTFSEAHLFRFAPETDLDEIVRQLNRALPDPGVRVQTHQTAGEQMTRTPSYLSDYLGLVSLVGLFLAALGSAYLYQSFLSRRLREIATLISLGVSHSHAILVYLVQASLLGTISAILAILLALVMLPFVNARVEQALDASLRLDAGFAALLPSLSMALLGGVLISVLVCLPLAVQIRRLKPAVLFQESSNLNMSWSRSSSVAALPVGVFAYFLSVWQAHSWKVGSLFYGGLLVSAVLLALIAFLILRLISAISVNDPINRISLRYLSRNRMSTVSAFLAIGLGALLINLLPQIQQSIESEIESPEVSSVPSLFLFDIQEEQVERLQTRLSELGAGVMQVSPLVRARLEAINGKAFEKPIEMERGTTREEEQEARSRNRGFNLTFREKLTESESLVEGRVFKGRVSEGQIPEISVEFRFAERLGIRIGDLLRFSVESVPIEGKVVSLRRVRWTSFQPNFFVVFQPGALDDAPKTYLASVQKLGLEERVRIQSGIVREFSNISIIDVSSVVHKLMQAFQQMTFALRLMAVLAVLAGLVVLFSIANHQARTRQAEIQLLKILGTGTGDISRIFAIEFGIIGVMSAVLGVGISTLLSFVISWQLFDRAWSFSPLLPLGTIGAVTFLTLVTTQAAAYRSLKQKPATLLGGEAT